MLFMLDWLESAELRRRCDAGLNKSEQRHSLVQIICTFKQGRIADRGIEAQQFRASGLNLAIAAIIFWNSTYIADAVAHLRAIGEPAPDTWLGHTSPLSWEHISLSGDFPWDRAAATAGKGRPPRRQNQLDLALQGHNINAYRLANRGSVVFSRRLQESHKNAGGFVG